MAFGVVNELIKEVHQSPPLDTTAPYDTDSVAGKTILITGGAAGFGAAFARKWAHLGAHIAVGDIDDAAGEALVAELRATTPGGQYHHYHHCDVTSWQSQVDFFRAAVQHSATGGIDVVVPNAGIVDPGSATTGRGFENPANAAGRDRDDLDADPAPPSLAVIEINLTGVLYSVHLALHWLPRNGRGKTAEEKEKEAAPRDRHILLMSSVAGIMPLPGQALYTTSKHGVAGLFRALRGTTHRYGIRVNMLCPYFVDTNILPAAGLMLLAGSGMGDAGDVVDAATRFVADEAVRGRSVVVGPRMFLDGDVADTAASVENLKLAGVPPKGAPADAVDSQGRKLKSVWECYGHDFENSEAFVLRYIRLLNAVTVLRGWTGYIKDVVGILFRSKERK